MGRCLTTPFITATLAIACMSACTLLSSLDDLRAVGTSSPQETGVDGGPSEQPHNDAQTFVPADEEGGTVLGEKDAAVDHTTTPFDANGFPGFDATPGTNDSGEPTTFTDDFERPAGDPLGNGWVERAGVAFTLENGAVSKKESVTRYRDNIVYRPASEDLLDVEVTIQMRALAAPITGNPQLWVRAQNIGPNVIDGYHIYFDDGFAHFHLARHRETVSEEVAAFDAPTDLNPDTTYRLLLRATGTSPVVVYSSLERQNGGGGWTLLAETGYVDHANDRVSTPGSVGFSADRQGNFVYDNFTRKSF